MFMRFLQCDQHLWADLLFKLNPFNKNIHVDYTTVLNDSLMVRSTSSVQWRPSEQNILHFCIFLTQSYHMTLEEYIFNILYIRIISCKGHTVTFFVLTQSFGEIKKKWKCVSLKKELLLTPYKLMNSIIDQSMTPISGACLKRRVYDVCS